MNFYHQLDAIMKQDMGGRGLLASLPENPIKKAAESLRHAARVILLTGFPVRMEDGGCIGETDGPSGTANLAFAFTRREPRSWWSQTGPPTISWRKPSPTGLPRRPFP